MEYIDPPGIWNTSVIIVKYLQTNIKYEIQCKIQYSPCATESIFQTFTETTSCAVKNISFTSWNIANLCAFQFYLAFRRCYYAIKSVLIVFIVLSGMITAVIALRAEEFHKNERIPPLAMLIGTNKFVRWGVAFPWEKELSANYLGLLLIIHSSCLLCFCVFLLGICF